MKNTEKVKQYTLNGYNCAQSILAAFGEDYGLQKDLAFKLAQNLGMGCAYRGEICGAASAALLVYGLKFGSDQPNDELSNEILYNFSSDHIKEFEKLHGSIQCRELLGYNVSIPHELDKIMELNLFRFKCPNLINDSARILERNIKSYDEKTNPNETNY
jgi:C_GCAxxG_C_C family probable redox protein